MSVYLLLITVGVLSQNTIAYSNQQIKYIKHVDAGEISQTNLTLPEPVYQNLNLLNT